MTRRDMIWRATGAALFAGACTSALFTDGSPLAVLLLPLALIGLAFMVHGKRVGVVLRAERRGHFHTASVVHARRRHRPDDS